MTTTTSELHLGLVKLGSMFPFEEDIISANAGDDRRVQQLRQLLLSQLDLIQKQSESLVAKDHTIKELKRENEALKKKVTSLEKSAKKQAAVIAKADPPVTSPSPPQIPKQQPLADVKQEIKVESNADQASSFPEQLEDECMETSEPYFTQQYIYDITETESDVETQKKAEEVPGWRVKPISASYIMEGTENIEDENLLKRHTKPENDEKRRKRWDVQRIREQRHVARLRARYDPNDGADNPLVTNPLKANQAEASKELEIKTLLPYPEEATEILVQETLPVSVFGCVLPKLNSKDFSLPWM